MLLIVHQVRLSRHVIADRLGLRQEIHSPILFKTDLSGFQKHWVTRLHSTLGTKQRGGGVLVVVGAKQGKRQRLWGRLTS